MKRTGLSSILQATRGENATLQHSIIKKLRLAMLSFIAETLEQEVQDLCGHRHSRKRGQNCHRNGSDQGSVVFFGQKVKIRKPRVKQSKVERPLKSYESLKGLDLMDERICQHMMSGVSTRDYTGLVEHISESLGVSKSSVSRSFARSSRRVLDDINGSDLSHYKPCAMMLDGIHFADRACVVAMGIDAKGHKHIMGLREGATENSTVVGDLLQNLEARGLQTNEPILFILDGSKALKKAVVRVFGKRALIQRCIHHKKRNILKYLPSAYANEFCRRWKLVHSTVCSSEAADEYAKLLDWLKSINHAAYQSLLEANEETLTVTRLELRVPLLKKTLQSTNPLESMFSFASARLSRVTHWKASTDQIVRWVAVAAALAQSRSRRVPGHLHLGHFIKKLQAHYEKLEFKDKVA